MNELLQEIESDVKDILDTDFNFYSTKEVPGLESQGLTFDRAVEKKGKTIKTCVLYADIRNSVEMTKNNSIETMGRIYTAFTKMIIKAASCNGGFVRNIIGDRVMIVFPSENCFSNAVRTAAIINHAAHKIIAKAFPNVNFKCGIGIDFGDLNVIKVGIPRLGDERSENKGLVWVGTPANVASRLTDVANKRIVEDYFLVTQNPVNWRAVLPFTPSILSLMFPPEQNLHEPLHLDEIRTVEMSPAEFANDLSSYTSGELYTMSGKYIKHEKKSRTISYPPILMTSVVLNGYKDENPTEDVDVFFKKISHDIPNVNGDIFGGNIIIK